MNVARPPLVADWLLRRLVSGPRQQSLIGDLHERYRRGQSAAWYWRQTLWAIAASTAWDIRRHPVLALRAVALTYVFLIPWVFFTGYAYGTTKWWMEDHVIRGSRLFHDFWVIYQAPLLVAWCFGWGLAGWLIASLQPQCRAGMTFVAVCAQLLWAVEYSVPIWRLANAGLPFFAGFTMIANVSIVVIGLPASLVCGSLCAVRPPLPTEADHSPTQT